MGLFEEASERIPGLVRVIFPKLAPDDRGEIAQRAAAKLLNRLAVPFLWTVIKNTGNDYLKERSAWRTADPDFPDSEPDRSPRLPLPVVRARLRVVYGDCNPWEAFA